jgi:acyl carrier protein
MKDRILSILTEIRPEFDFSKSNNFIKEGLLDSFDVFNLVNSLDEEFGISIDGVDILAENFSSIEKIAALLTKNGVKS